MFGFGAAAAQEPTEPKPPEVEPKPSDTPLEGLDKFAKIFDNGEDDKPKEGDTVEPIPFDPVTLLADTEATDQLLSRLDFSKAISEETQKKLQDQSPDAIISLTNDVAKASYLQAMQHNAAIIKQYVQEQLAAQGSKVSSQISSSISDADLAKALPEINNPIIAAGIQPFISKYRAQNPNATAEDVATITKDYLKELHTSLNPDDKPNPDKLSEGIDWEEELGFSFS